MRRIFLYIALFFFVAISMLAEEIPDSLSNDDLRRFGYPNPMHVDLDVPRRAPQAEDCPVDSVVGTDFNDNYLTKEEYEYNASGKLFCKTTFKWVNGQKDTVSQNNTLYDETGRNIGVINYTWSNGVKKGAKRTWSKYINGTKTTSVNYKWDATNKKWIGKDSTQYTYNDKGWESAEEVFNWSTATNDWYPYTRKDYEYYSKSQVTLYLYSEWNGTELAPKRKQECEYTAKGQTKLAILNYSAGQWIGESQTLTWFDDKGNTEKTEKYSGWENDNWKGNSKDSCIYNVNNKVSEKTEFAWSAGKWVKFKKTNTEYDDSNVSDLAVYAWNNEDWKGDSRTSSTWTGGKQTLITAWTWNTTLSKWEKSTENENAYSGSQQTLNANYKYTDGVREGISKTEYAYTSHGDLTSQIEYTWKENDWVGAAKTEKTYSASNKLLSSTTFDWVDTDWVGKDQTENTYDTADKLMEELTTKWNGTAWENVKHTLYINYNTDGTPVLQVGEKWESAAWQATDSVWHHMVYDGNGWLTEDYKEKWTASSGKWVGVDKKTITQYDEVGNKVNVNTYTYSGGKWINNVHYQYAYKDKNKNLPTLNLQETWNKVQNKWIGNHKYEYAYNELNQETAKTLYNGWSTTKNDWVGDTKIVNVYDGSTQIISSRFSWDSNSWSWVGASYIHYVARDAAGRVTEQIMSTTYDNTTEKWVNEDREVYVYDNTHEAPIITEIYEWSTEGSKWCLVSADESSYDSEAKGGNLRYVLSETYTDCELSTSNLKHYYYRCDPKKYTITFVNWNDTTLATITVEEENQPIYPTDVAQPLRTEDAGFTYSFNGWSPEIETVNGPATYVAQFTATPKVPTDMDAILESSIPQIFKLIKDGQLFILRNGEIYNVQGIRVK